MNRRGRLRQPLRLSLRIQNSANQQVRETSTIDFHCSGLFVEELPPQTEVGDFVLIEFLHGPECAPTTGRVQHRRGESAGVALLEMPEMMSRFLEQLGEQGVELGPYRLIQHLGTGGMAQVYLAHDSRGRSLVVKRLLPHFARDPAAIELFATEATLLERCNPPSFPAFRTYGECDGTYYLAMERISGCSLDEALEGGRRIAPAVARAIVIELLGALEQLHALPFGDAIVCAIHGDVSPRNVMVDEFGRVVLLDLGACSTPLAPRPKGYELMGTLPYLAPSLLDGKTPYPGVDFWALACLYYELLTGSSPFARGSNYDTIRAIQGASFRPLSRSGIDGTSPTDEVFIERCFDHELRQLAVPSPGELRALLLNGDVAPNRELPAGLQGSIEAGTSTPLSRPAMATTTRIAT